ncbi:putative baseplate assembly protein [Natronolimnobius sp. AArcel1]|uniref:putative baseplate assembly protein n=1 Tax=Natronolimnobius sp. AArcel1 TaxID=1679093 RepID=UPI0013EA1DC6|nr:putative baseplate assembly protein [Natronolimnobius sp. AArcel1]NGM68015.1 putative baseplate assembly protein [Natronolimnobius sp. AArcel1]
MGLDVPELDDREYEALLEQATKLIPAYSDEWTDFNPHDPGITILEVLAWLTETHSYQLDQITDEHREKYLRLIDHGCRPPKPATAQLQLFPPAAVSGDRLPAGTQLAVTDGSDAVYRFETNHDVVCSAAEIQRVITVDETGTTDHGEANQTDGMFYRPFGDEITRGDAVYLGFDRDPFENKESLTLSVDYHDENLPDPEPPQSDEAPPTFTPSVALAWEYRDPETETWRALSVVADETDVLYGGGWLELIDDSDETTSSEDDDSSPEPATTGEVWIRCRVEKPGYEIPPQVNAIRPNVVSASHAVSVSNERLSPVGDANWSETSPALDGQTYAFEHDPVLSATVYVDGDRFVEVPDFDASSPDDSHYVLDQTRGQVTFGTGVAGRVPPPDATITADYVTGGGTDGNVSSSAVWRFSDSNTELTAGVSPADIDVEPLRAATCGTDEETVDAALRRARRDLRRPHRAVTEDDYRYLASRTPGLRIGRTTVLVDGDQTTVVVVPYAPRDIPSPEPSEGFLEAVNRHLRERTLLTDRIHVSGPRYVRLELTVTGRTRPRYTDSGHEAAITDAVESYLHPLYGYNGEGWPFGRRLEGAGLADVIGAVDAIDEVTDIAITAHGGTTVDDRTVLIDETSLFTVADVTVDLTTASRRGD